MKLLRIALVSCLLLLAVSPAFALPCESCTGETYPYCLSTPGSHTRCLIGIDWCQTKTAPTCSGFMDSAAGPVLAEWTVASIEINRSGEGTKVVTAPSAIAEAGVSTTSLLK